MNEDAQKMQGKLLLGESNYGSKFSTWLKQGTLARKSTKGDDIAASEDVEWIKGRGFRRVLVGTKIERKKDDVPFFAPPKKANKETASEQSRESRDEGQSIIFDRSNSIIFQDSLSLQSTNSDSLKWQVNDWRQRQFQTCSALNTSLALTEL